MITLSVRFVVGAVVRFGVVLVLVVSGCGSVSVSDPVVPRERPRIGFVVSNRTLSFAREQTEGFHVGARIAGGVEAVVGGPSTHDVAQQLEQVRAMAAHTKGGMAVSTTAPALLASSFAETTARGIPLAVLGGRSTSASGAGLLIENDNYEVGRLLAAEAIKRLPAEVDGKVVLGSTAPAHPALDQRSRGIRDEFARKRPRVRVMGPFDTQRDQRINLDSWQLLVAANLDAVAFLGTGDIDVANLAAVRGRRQANWLAGGFSVDSQVLRAVRDGQLFAVISPEHFLKAAVAGWLLAQHATAARPLPEGWLTAPALPVTSANVDEIIHRQSSEATKLAWWKPQIDAITSNPSRFLQPLEKAR